MLFRLPQSAQGGLCLSAINVSVLLLTFDGEDLPCTSAVTDCKTGCIFMFLTAAFGPADVDSLS